MHYAYWYTFRNADSNRYLPEHSGECKGRACGIWVELVEISKDWFYWAILSHRLGWSRET